MKLCLFSATFDPDLASPEAVFQRHWHVVHLARALRGGGHQVGIVQVFDRVSEHRDDDGSFRVTTVGLRDALQALEVFDPDAVHFFGVTLRAPLRHVARWATKAGRVATVSYHGGRPSRNPVSRWLHARALRGMSACMFPSTSSAALWQTAGMIGAHTAIHILPEVSSPFSGVPREQARHHLGLRGGPVFAWSGRLAPVKDPLTALEAFRRICRDCPDAQLLMAYQTSPLMPDVDAFLQRHPHMRERVRLMGALPHDQIEVLFSAADFFVQSSLEEIGGNSLVEALSCGAIPVVTDIPSFRMITEHIGPARSFACGDADGMAAVVADTLRADLSALSTQVKQDFEASLSYSVLARSYVEAIQVAGLAGGVRVERYRPSRPA